MIWFLLSLLGLVIIVLSIFYFISEAKSRENKNVRTFFFIFDLIFSAASGAILIGLGLIIIGWLKAINLWE